MDRETFASFVATWIIILLLALILLTGKPISPAPIAPAVTNIYKKYYVAPPIEAPPIELEGDYSTWTEIWEYDFPEVLKGLSYVSITLSPDYLYIHYFDDSSNKRFVIIGIADASAKFTSPSGSDYTAAYPSNEYAGFFLFNILVHGGSGGLCFSVLGKYALVVLTNSTRIEVWKDGVKVWTSPLASEAVSGASTYGAFGIRYDGKYVIAVTDTKKLVCFEGS